MDIIRFFFSGTIVLFLLAGCKSYDEQEAELPDTPYRGRLVVSADESFKPVLDEMKQVYESNHPDTEIAIHYKPEAECLNDMLNDTVRMVITTRGFLPDEAQAIIDSFKIGPRKMEVARDAIAVIVHPNSRHWQFTMQDIKEILTGKYKAPLVPIFDGLKATSTIRYILDSVLRGDSLVKTSRAAEDSKGVIDYIARNPNAVGFIGVEWVGDRDDSLQINFLKKIKVAQIESEDLKGRYVLPVQANIYLNRYPMTRHLTYVYRENHRGLGKGFADFMSGEIGQLIFKRAYLMPVQKNFGIRPIRIVEY